ncbi:sensor histidine kinase [Reichenbachiella sp.]|uniref:sensor histidine kinase n=1 Tax=Reichenbachiella sp. TaxID=2184521 RepID=UPI003B5C3671
MRKNFHKYTEPLIHIVVWVGIITINTQGENELLSVEQHQTLIEFNVKTLSLFAFVGSAVLFYVNILLLNRFYYRREKFLAFTLLIAIVFIVFYVLEYFILHSFLGPIASVFQKDLIINHFVFLLFSIIYIVVKDRFRIESQNKLATAEQLTNELQFLKSQLNPHFLFNCINNIYATSVENGDEEVAKQIADLTKVLRYTLYESNQSKVPLDHEIQFLKGYIDLNLLKFEVGELDFLFDICGETSQIKITPLVLVPLVENAFKHGTHPDNKSHIHIDLSIKKGILLLKVENSISNGKNKPESKDGGVGLINLRRRLELLYPDAHKLKIKKDTDFYQVKLQLRLNTTDE